MRTNRAVLEEEVDHLDVPVGRSMLPRPASAAPSNGEWAGAWQLVRNEDQQAVIDPHPSFESVKVKRRQP
jgi:hypothetical protein